MSIKLLAGVVFFVASSVPTGTGQRSPVTPAEREPNAAVEQSAVGNERAVSKPVRRLFTTQPTTPPDPFHFQDRLRDRIQRDSIQAQQPRSVCGLTIWDVDPDLDRRMRITPPQPPDVTYTIRKLTPPVCQE